MMRLDLPAYHWFVSRPEGRFVTNIYSGSTGTDKDTGCMNTRTFHYRVYVDITSGNFPRIIGREENNAWLMAGDLVVKIYRKDDTEA